MRATDRGNDGAVVVGVEVKVYCYYCFIMFDLQYLCFLCIHVYFILNLKSFLSYCCFFIFIIIVFVLAFLCCSYDLCFSMVIDNAVYMGCSNLIFTHMKCLVIIIVVAIDLYDEFDCYNDAFQLFLYPF